MSAIFISHSSLDNDFSVALAERLTARHHNSLFLDLDPDQGIVAGQSWERTLYRELERSQAVIVLLPPCA